MQYNPIIGYKWLFKICLVQQGKQIMTSLRLLKLASVESTKKKILCKCNPSSVTRELLWDTRALCSAYLVKSIEESKISSLLCTHVPECIWVGGEKNRDTVQINLVLPTDEAPWQPFREEIMECCLVIMKVKTENQTHTGKQSPLRCSSPNFNIQFLPTQEAVII